jgi:hypothetical protein
MDLSQTLFSWDVAMPAGYSKSPLSKKLGIKEGSKVTLIGEPAEYTSWLEALPDDVKFQKKVTGDTHLVHLFVVDRNKLKSQLEQLRNKIDEGAAIWVSWPKKTSKVATTVTEDVIREIALPLGFVDIKVCAVTDVWSGLKIVIRQEFRTKTGKKGNKA